jgi:hypothetical protein
MGADGAWPPAATLAPTVIPAQDRAAASRAAATDPLHAGPRGVPDAHLHLGGVRLRGAGVSLRPAEADHATGAYLDAACARRPRRRLGRVRLGGAPEGNQPPGEHGSAHGALDP